MCVAVAGKVVKVEKNRAKVSFDGALLEVATDFVKDVKIGDYLLIHAGYALEKVKEEQAIETINTFKELQEIEVLE